MSDFFTLISERNGHNREDKTFSYNAYLVLVIGSYCFFGNGINNSQGQNQI